MGDEEEFKAEGFSQFTTAEGIKTVDVMDEKKEFQYKARCFINKAKTIGYAEVDMEGSTEIAFLSKTSDGTIFTLTGEQTTRLPMDVEGLHTIMSVLKDTPVSTICAEHKKAFDGKTAIPDEAWLKEETPKIPIKAIDVGVAFIKQFMQAFDGLAEQMGQVVGEIGKGLGQAMEQAFTGIGEAMQPAPTDADQGQVDTITPEELGIKKSTPKPKPKKKAPAKEAPAKKAAPSKKKSTPTKKKGKAGPKKKKR